MSASQFESNCDEYRNRAVAARESRRIEKASMITANALSRAAGIAAVAAGVLFIGGQPAIRS